MSKLKKDKIGKTRLKITIIISYYGYLKNKMEMLMSKRKSKQIKKLSQTKKEESKIEIKGNHELEKFLDNCSRERRIIENFGRNSVKRISNVNLEKVDFKNLTLKNCEFVDSKIKFSHISENSYLRKSTFSNVDFTGTVFEKVNLEKAKFEDCKLYYVR